MQSSDFRQLGQNYKLRSCLKSQLVQIWDTCCDNKFYHKTVYFVWNPDIRISGFQSSTLKCNFLTHHNFFWLRLFFFYHFCAWFVVFLKMEKQVPLSHEPHVTKVALVPGSHLGLHRDRSKLFLWTSGLWISDNYFVCDWLPKKCLLNVKRESDLSSLKLKTYTRGLNLGGLDPKTKQFEN